MALMLMFSHLVDVMYLVVMHELCNSVHVRRQSDEYVEVNRHVVNFT